MVDVLIVGCGDIGTRLGLALHGQGHRVWGLRRQTALLPPEINPVARDLAQPFTLDGVPSPRLVFYTAAAGARDEAAYRRAYLDGPAHLLAALQAYDNPPERLLFISSTSVYGQKNGEWVDERSPTEPATFSGKIMVEAERRLAAGPIPVTSVRLSGIYGPGRHWLLRLAQSGATCQQHPPRYSNRVHCDDGAAILAHLAALPQPEACYLATDGHPVPLHEVLDWIRAQLAAAGVALATDGRDMPPRGNKRCRNDRLLATGYRFIHADFRDGYRTLIADWAASLKP